MDENIKVIDEIERWRRFGKMIVRNIGRDGSMPLVSVLLTSYNHEKYLRESIDSVLQQTFMDFELVILDDASTDHSWEIIQEYRDSRIVAIRRPVNQYYPLTEEVIGRLQGKYLAVHHSDDVWEPTKLEKQVKYMENSPNVAACFTLVAFIDETSKSYKLDDNNFYKHVFEQENRSKEDWLHYFFYEGNCLCHPSVIIRRSLYEKYLLWDRIGFCQLPDFYRWVSLCLHEEIYIYPEKLVRFRLRRNYQDNTSGDRLDVNIRSQWETYHLLQKYGEIKDDEMFLKIFPEARQYLVDHKINRDFALAELSLKINKPAYQLFGLEKLFALLSNDVLSKEIEDLYGYTYQLFIQDTAKYDIFNITQLSKCIAANLYVDYGTGYEECCINKKVYIRHDGSFSVHFNVDVGAKKVRSFRFDPGEGEFIRVALTNVSINGKYVKAKALNNKYTVAGVDVFYTMDPQYRIMFEDAGCVHLVIDGQFQEDGMLSNEVEKFWAQQNRVMMEQTNRIIELETLHNLDTLYNKVMNNPFYKIYRGLKQICRRLERFL